MQTTYTSFTTQSLAYIELETGNFDAFKDEISSIPPHDEAYPAMLIIQIGENKTDLIRWNIADNAEEKPDNRWFLITRLQRGILNTLTTSGSMPRQIRILRQMVSPMTVPFPPI